MKRIDFIKIEAGDKDRVAEINEMFDELRYNLIMVELFQVHDKMTLDEYEDHRLKSNRIMKLLANEDVEVTRLRSERIMKLLADVIDLKIKIARLK